MAYQQANAGGQVKLAANWKQLVSPIKPLKLDKTLGDNTYTVLRAVNYGASNEEAEWVYTLKTPVLGMLEVNGRYLDAA